MRRSSFILLIILSACAQVETRRGSPKESGATFDDKPSQAASQPPVVEEPHEARKVAIILGPGAAKTFVYPAIIKSLMQKKIPIHKVVGIEWGALAGGLFALTGKPHEADWKIYKLDPKLLRPGGIFSSSGPVEAKKLDNYLKENLTEAPLATTVIPFVCPTLSLRRGAVTLRSESLLWMTVRNCLVSAPQVAPNNEWAPALFSLKEMTDELRNEGFNTLIFVNALGGNEIFGPADKDLSWSERLLWLEIRREIWSSRPQFTDFIDIDTKGFSLFDFTAKKELSALGQKAGDAASTALSSKYNF